MSRWYNLLIMKDISDFSTYVMGRTLQWLHMWRNFSYLHICQVKKFEISPHDILGLLGLNFSVRWPNLWMDPQPGPKQTPKRTSKWTPMRTHERSPWILYFVPSARLTCRGDNHHCQWPNSTPIEGHTSYKMGRGIHFLINAFGRKYVFPQTISHSFLSNIYSLK